MRKGRKGIAALLFLPFFWAPLAARPQDIKPAVYAGQFYEKDPGRLAAQIDGYLEKAAARPPQLTQKIRALVSPHAGYVYSGQAAAHGYALVRGRAYETVVVIGPSHRIGFRGCSIYPEGGFQTPLGVAEIDAKLATDISKITGFGLVREAFAEEHSVEVQIPFIQRALPGAKIVPIIMGYQTGTTIRALARGLVKASAGKNVLIVASTDLSHFLSKDEASATDIRTIALIQSLKTDALIQKIEANENIMCGGGPVVAALLYTQALGAAGVEVLNHTDSSALGGSRQVVGYLSAAIYSTNGADPPESLRLSPEDKAILLSLARSALTDFVTHTKVIPSPIQQPHLRTLRGVFVTLKKDGNLRGCIGFVEPFLALDQAIIQASIYAATRDSRFPPVTAGEIKDLTIEISILSPLFLIKDPMSIEVGKHGLLISSNGHQGLLLPQVPVDNGWGRRTFLEQACRKAGLAADAWKKGAQIFVFEAIVFHEAE